MAAACKMVGCLFVLAALVQCAMAQTRHIVGDNSGWTVPAASDPSAYSNWAASKTFRVGDTLVFNFPAGSHDVTTVTKTAYDACSSSSPIKPAVSTSPTTITLTEGDHYYLCSVTGHCAGGQKLAINVTRSGSTTTPPTTTTPTSPPAVRPPSNSAPSLTVTGFSATILSVASVVALLF